MSADGRSFEEPVGLKRYLGFSIFLILVGGYAVYSASFWSFKTGFFPLVIAIPLILLALAHLLLEVFGDSEKDVGPAVDVEFSKEIAPDVARWRAFVLFAWIVGFILIVFLLGFPIAVPLFMFLYLKMQSGTGWLQSLGLAGGAWVFLYVLFQRLVYLPFEPGALQVWLGL